MLIFTHVFMLIFTPMWVCLILPAINIQSEHCLESFLYNLKWLDIFVITQMLLLCIFSPTNDSWTKSRILTLLIISRGPNYQIKSVMTGLTINNYSILKYWVENYNYFCNFISFRNTNEFEMYRDVKSKLRNEFTT